MKTIAISFTPKGQDLEKIFEKLELIAEKHSGSILVHGFLPRTEIDKRDLGPEIVNKLDELFPFQLNLWKEKPLREEMAYVMNKLEGRVYVIGDIVDGVKEEMDEYKKYNLEVVHHVL